MTWPAPASRVCLRVGDPRTGSVPSQIPPGLSLHSPQQGESRTRCQHPMQPLLQGVGACGIPLSTQRGSGEHSAPPQVSPLHPPPQHR